MLGALNIWGDTESTDVAATVHGQDQWVTSLIPIGRPTFNTSYRSTPRADRQHRRSAVIG